MPNKTTSPKRTSAYIAIPENELPNPALRSFWDREMRRCKQSFDQTGSLPALADALICCHQSHNPIPTWVARGTIAVIKAYFTRRPLLFNGKAIRRSGRDNGLASRHRYSLVEFARWECVNEIKDRQEEFTESIPYLSNKERERAPEFAKLIEEKFSLNHRYAVAVEHLALWNDPAQCDYEQLVKSYKKVQTAMRRANTGAYHLPGYRNPLMSTNDPDLMGNKPS